MTKNNENLWYKIQFIMLPILSITAYYYLTKYLNMLVFELFLGILKIPMMQFIEFMYLSDVLIALIQLIIFFVIYKLLVKRNDDESRKIQDSALQQVSEFQVFLLSGLQLQEIYLRFRHRLLQ